MRPNYFLEMTKKWLEDQMRQAIKRLLGPRFIFIGCIVSLMFLLFHLQEAYGFEASGNVK
jgi:hypothetical protein